MFSANRWCLLIFALVTKMTTGDLMRSRLPFQLFQKEYAC